MSCLAKYELADVGVLHLRDAEDELMYAEGADGSPDTSKPRRIHLFGPGSRQHAKAQTTLKNNLFARMQRKGGKVKLTAEEERQQSAEFLAECTKAFENIESETGATGEGLFMEVYMNPKLTFIAQQAETFARDTSNFKPAPSKS